MNGILVPGGFGERGTEGKINAVTFARTRNVPFFGICFGMQMAVIETARHLAGVNSASSSEFGETTEPVVGLLTEWLKGNALETRLAQGDMGGTMRLGAYPAILKKGSHIAEIYGDTEISERHRHRYEVNIDYMKRLEAVGLSFAGMSPDNLLPGDDRVPRPSLVRRGAISSGAEIAAVRAASAVCELHCGGGGAEQAGVIDM